MRPCRSIIYTYTYNKHIMKAIALLATLYNVVLFTNGASNMNGEYVVASGNNQNVNYNTDYASKGYEYFDIWAPEIATHYGDVFWTR